MEEDQLIEVLLHTEKWHKSGIEQLKLISESDKDTKIQVQGQDDIEITGELKKGFKLGVFMALQLLGKLPYSLEKEIHDGEA